MLQILDKELVILRVVLDLEPEVSQPGNFFLNRGVPLLIERVQRVLLLLVGVNQLIAQGNLFARVVGVGELQVERVFVNADTIQPFERLAEPVDFRDIRLDLPLYPN